MKNHWLDKKIEKEIDEALQTPPSFSVDLNIDLSLDFKDSDFVDLSTTMNKDGPGTRYKEYERLELAEKFIDENIKALDFGVDEHDKAVVTEILLKHKNDLKWIEGILTDIGYYKNTNITTIDTTNAVMSNCNDNFTITIGDKWPDNPVTTYTASADLPGWKDGKIIDMDKWKGKCEICGEYQWPMNDEHTMMQGDPGCACTGSNANLDIFYPNRYIQEETLQVLGDKDMITTYQTMYTPVLPGSMSGYICLDEQCPPVNGFTFTVSEDGKFDVKRCGEWAKQPTVQEVANGMLTLYYDEIYSWETSLNCTTGVLELHHHTAGAKPPKLVVNYEYNKEGP